MRDDVTTIRTRLTRGAVGNKSSYSCSYLDNNQQKRKGSKDLLVILVGGDGATAHLSAPTPQW